MPGRLCVRGAARFGVRCEFGSARADGDYDLAGAENGKPYWQKQYSRETIEHRQAPQPIPTGKAGGTVDRRERFGAQNNVSGA